MIYEKINNDDPIRQGDIFLNVPFVSLVCENDVLISEDKDEFVERRLSSLISEVGKKFYTLAELTFVPGIVISQDCDATRAETISLAHIIPLTTPFDFSKKLQQQCRLIRQINSDADKRRYFYLPAELKYLNFSKEMVVDFRSIIPLKRQDSNLLINQRKAKLNSEAKEHFKEKLAQFFRQYPVDEWYSFTKEQLNEYQKEREDVKPKPWQV